MANQGGQDQLVVSDLFFGLSAILLIVVALMSAEVREFTVSAARNVGSGQGSDTAVAAMAAAEQSYAVLASGKRAVFYEPNGSSVSIDRDALLGSAMIRDWVGRAQRSSGAPVVVIDPDGSEAAFLLEPALAQAGLERFSRIRLIRGCRALKLGPTAAECGNDP